VTLSALTGVLCGLCAGAGHAIKAANNQLTATGIWSTGEMLVALAKLGVDPTVALAAINKSSGRRSLAAIT
jgi:3-hydroxyisobutyrate dehydrogenase